MMIAEYFLRGALFFGGAYWSTSTLQCFKALIDSLREHDL